LVEGNTFLPISINLIEAIRDMRYLLSRGYKRELAVNFIANRYMLSKDEKAILYRAVYSKLQAAEHKRKIVSPTHIKGKKVAVDGFNVLITIESALMGKKIFLCDDGFIRDTSAIFGKYKFSNLTKLSLELTLNFLKKYKPKFIAFFFDSPISKSGEIAGLTRFLLKKHGIPGDAKAIKQVDKAVIEQGEIVASSDHIIIERAKHVLDLAGEIIKEKYPQLIIDLNKVK